MAAQEKAVAPSVAVAKETCRDDRSCNLSWLAYPKTLQRTSPDEAEDQPSQGSGDFLSGRSTLLLAGGGSQHAGEGMGEHEGINGADCVTDRSDLPRIRQVCDQFLQEGRKPIAVAVIAVWAIMSLCALLRLP